MKFRFEIQLKKATIHLQPNVQLVLFTRGYTLMGMATVSTDSWKDTSECAISFNFFVFIADTVRTNL